MSIKSHAPLRRVRTSTSAASLIGSCVAAAACFALPVAAEAQPAEPGTQEATTLPKITVTGNPRANPNADPQAPYKIDRSGNSKFTEELLNTPKTVTIIPKEVIEDTGVKSFRDLVRTQPGITLGTGEGGNAFGDRIFIRGFEARTDIFIDGIRDPGVISREIFAVEQIEIAKGPGSAFAGRGSTGGAVNMVSKEPLGTTFYSGEATYGSADTKRVTVDVNQVVTDRFVVRVNGMWHDADVPGRDYVTNKRWGGAIAALYDITDNIRFKADYYHLDTDDLPDWGMPFDARTSKPFEGVPRDTFYGLVQRDFMENVSDIVTGGIEWEISPSAKLESRVRWGKTSNRYVVSAPESPPTLAAGANSWQNPASTWTVRSNPKNRNSENLALATQNDITWTFDTGRLSHTFVGGIEASNETIFNRPYNGLTSELGSGVPTIVSLSAVVQPLLAPDPLRQGFGDPVAGPNWTEANVKTAAVYLIDTIKLSEQWQILGGVRYDYYNIVREANNADQLTNTSQFINWHAGLVYKPVPAGTLYGAVGTSSNPSGEFVDGSPSAVYGGLIAGATGLEPERTRSYEVGVKWSLFDEHLLFTTALFRTEKDNARESVPGGGGIIVLSGKQRVHGVEVGLGGNITPRWQMFGGVTVLDTKVVASQTPSEVGRAFANIPETTFSLLTDYLVVSSLKVGAQAYYSGKKWGGNFASSNAAYTPEYVRLDLNASYELTDNVKLRFNALNVTDAVYYDALYRSGAPFAYIAPGRSFLGSIGVTF